MRLFGTFKSIEVYLIISAIFLLYTFDQLCEKKEEIVAMSYVKPTAAPLKTQKLNGTLDDAPPLDSLVILDKNGTAILINGPPAAASNLTAPSSMVINDTQRSSIGSAPAPAIYIGETTRASRMETVKASVNDLEKYNLPTDPPTVETIPEKLLQKIDVAITTEAPPLSAVEIVHAPAAVDVPVIAPAKELREEPKVVVRPNIASTPATFVAASRDNRIEMVKVPVTEQIEVVKVPATETPAAVIKNDHPAAVAAPGLWDNILGVFGGGSSSANKRVKREIVSTGDGKTKMVENQTHFDVYRCKCLKAGTILTHMNPFNKQNVIQQMFAWRFWGILLLTIHLLLVLYHSIVNCVHRVPTSHRFNRVFAFIGLIIWNLITLWIIYQWLMWNNKFLYQASPIVPSIPSEFYAFLALSFAMNIILLYEFVTPMTFFLSYDITPRHPRRGYIPAAQSENEYISGIIRQLEAAPQQESPPKNRPVIRAFENNMV